MIYLCLQSEAYFCVLNCCKGQLHKSTDVLLTAIQFWTFFRVLLRIRLLYYLKQDVIGDLAEKIMAGVPYEQIDLDVPWHPELPVNWWDGDADKSLLIGIYKHGKHITD